jgi:hypothetical protein
MMWDKLPLCHHNTKWRNPIQEFCLKNVMSHKTTSPLDCSMTWHDMMMTLAYASNLYSTPPNSWHQSPCFGIQPQPRFNSLRHDKSWNVPPLKYMWTQNSAKWKQKWWVKCSLYLMNRLLLENAPTQGRITPKPKIKSFTYEAWFWAQKNKRKHLWLIVHKWIRLHVSNIYIILLPWNI